MNRLIIQIAFTMLGYFATAQTVPLNDHAVCFYYNWYGSHKTDKQLHHWSHPVMPQNDKDTTKRFFPGDGNIGANFYPATGEYSSADSMLIDQHMQQVAQAGIGLLAVTWLGEDDYTYSSVPLLLNAAARHGVKICFQIEPRVRKTALSTRNAVIFLIQKFGTHPAFYHDHNTKHPMFFVYDSYVIPAKEWMEVFGKKGDSTIRTTEFDADMIGLWVWKEDEAFFLNSGFDGFYTYFASAGFTYGSTPSNWPTLQHWADAHHMMFIPSVGPGYIDSRIRPWNITNTKDREHGKYYDRMFEAAIAAHVHWIGITSFNEWHEGTQIEPAKPFRYDDFQYLDYSPLPGDYYLNRTRYWLEHWKK